jgi:hypothetical protein
MAADALESHYIKASWYTASSSPVLMQQICPHDAIQVPQDVPVNTRTNLNSLDVKINL